MYIGILALFLFDVALGNQVLSTNTSEFWDESEAFGETNTPSENLRLPSHIIPSFYRLKLKTDLYNSSFTGDVYITIKATKPVKKIILHAKDLKINNDARLTEQVYEKVGVFHSKAKREASSEPTITEITPKEATNSSETVTSQNITTETIAEHTITINNDTTPLQINSTESDLPTEVANVTETTADPKEVSGPKEPVETQVTHSSVRDVKIVSITQGAGDRLILTLGNALRVGVDYTLELSFEGAISNALTGFYKSTYEDEQKQSRSLGVTQFEPTSARAAFPCFDEPEFKAKFEISIAHARNLTALSNMKVASDEEIPDRPDWVWTHFERSVNMSSYLVAYVLADFRSLETSYTGRDNVTKPVRVWARPQLLHKAAYALSITPKLLAYYEELFGVPYALDKLDLVAIPDFSSGAMENWGLITFRETGLLYDEAEGVPRDKQSVAVDVAHELAHQWFGNLVTMRWWTDLWLNEGFATYIEYVGVDRIEPEWAMFESFTQDKMDLLRTDALKNTSPVSRPVTHAAEISQKFDEISYTKGANLIRMLNHTITGELFHKGLLIYLNEWKFSNAEENDLWRAMAAGGAGGVAVVDFMNSWTRQAGYPVVDVKRNYDTGEITFEQRLFTTAREPYPSMAEQLWHIPLTYRAVAGHASPATGHTSPATGHASPATAWLRERSVSLASNVSDKDALYVNVDAIGYYRVNYDARNWELVRAALQAGLLPGPTAKAQLLDDAFNLAKVSRLNYSYALDLATFVRDGEDSKMVWDVLLDNLAFLRFSLKATPAYLPFQEYVLSLISNRLAALQYGLAAPRDARHALHAESVLAWACAVQAPRCLAWARRQFRAWMDQPDFNVNPIPRHLRSLACAMALRHGGRAEFDFLWRVFRSSSDPAARSLAITNLPSTRDASLVAMLLEKSLTEIPPQYAVSVWSVDSIVGAKVARDFLTQHWARVYDKFVRMDPFMFPGVLNGAFGSVNTEAELDRLKQFALKHKEELRPMSQTLQKLVDAANFRIEWRAQHLPGIEAWLRDYAAAHPSPDGISTEKPGNSTQNPGNSTQNPGNSTQNPGNSTQNAGNSTQNRGNSTQNPGNSTQNAGNSTQNAGNTMSTEAPTSTALPTTEANKTPLANVISTDNGSVTTNATTTQSNAGV